MSKSMTEFWEAKHREQDIGALSGNGIITTFYLHLDDLWPEAYDILNIGVGLGKWEEACVGAGKMVSSVDCTQEACECIADVAQAFMVGVENIHQDSYDLITELLVAQHLSSVEMFDHMKYAIAGLRMGGVYAVQSPTLIDPITPEQEAEMVTERFRQGGRVCRSQEWFEETAKECGGRVIGIHRVWKFPEFNMIWNAYHIERVA